MLSANSLAVGCYRYSSKHELLGMVNSDFRKHRCVTMQWCLAQHRLYHLSGQTASLRNSKFGTFRKTRSVILLSPMFPRSIIISLNFRTVWNHRLMRTSFSLICGLEQFRSTFFLLPKFIFCLHL